MAAQEHSPHRAAVIGLGWPGRSHARAYLDLPGVDVVAVVDPDRARAETVATDLAVPVTYSNVEELLAKDEVDLVSVCTPNDLHAPISCAALDAGKHVLVEKPMAVSAAEARQMVQAARRAGRVLEVAFNYRQRGDVETLVSHIQTGGLGNIYHARASWRRRRGIPNRVWFHHRAVAGGGPLVDLGVHVLDLALHLLGEPAVHAVSACTHAELAPSLLDAGSVFDVEDHAVCLLRLEQGASLVVEVSWAEHMATDNEVRVELAGTQGGAVLAIENYATSDTLRLYGNLAGEPVELRPVTKPPRGHAGVVRRFVGVVDSGELPGHQGEEGLRRVEIVDACYLSAELGHEIQPATRLR